VCWGLLDVLDVPDVLDVMRRVVLCMLEAVEVMRCVLLCVLGVVEGGFRLLEVMKMIAHELNFGVVLMGRGSKAPIPMEIARTRRPKSNRKIHALLNFLRNKVSTENSYHPAQLFSP